MENTSIHQPDQHPPKFPPKKFHHPHTDDFSYITKTDHQQQQQQGLQSQQQQQHQQRIQQQQQQQQQQTPLDQTAMENIKQMHMEMARLRIFMKQQNLEQAGQCDINAQQLTPYNRQKLQELVTSVGKMCCETLKYEGVNIGAMVSATSANCWDLYSDGMAPWSSAEPALWINVVQSIALNKEQIEKLLELRMEFLCRLGDLFEQRQILNQQVVGFLGKLQRGGSSEEEEEEEVTSDQTSDRSTYETKLQTQISLTYDQLKLNLRREQALYTVLDKKILQILTHLQLAWGMQISYPEHCDCLAFVNAVHEIFAEQEI